MDALRFKAEVFVLKDLLYRLAMRLLNNDADAQDAVQQLMMKLWQKREGLADVVHLRSFVTKALQNDCFNRLKKDQTVARHYQQIAAIQQHTRQVVPGNMVQIIINEINKLPEKQRVVIHLSDVEGFDAKEIAEIVEMDEGAVRANLSRARKKIKIQIQKITSYEERQL